MEFMDLISSNPSHQEIILSLWNTSVPKEFRFSRKFVKYNLCPLRNVIRSGKIALHRNRPIGYVLVEACNGHPNPGTGWIVSLCVAANFQRKEIGSELIKWGEAWLAEQHVSRIQVGASLRPFTAHIPEDLNCYGFFEKVGYVNKSPDPYVWDLACDLRDYQSLFPMSTETVDLSILQSHEIPLFYEFLNREFPGRWLYEFSTSLENNGTLPIICRLKIGSKIEGMCWVNYARTGRPMDRYYHANLEKPFGQLGTVGVAKELRGRGYGLALIDYGLMYLKRKGVRGTVIDWTTLLDYYGKFGFTPFRRYIQMEKELNE